jgi:hypothetical protein
VGLGHGDHPRHRVARDHRRAHVHRDGPAGTRAAEPLDLRVEVARGRGRDRVHRRRQGERLGHSGDRVVGPGRRRGRQGQAGDVVAACRHAATIDAVVGPLELAAAHPRRPGAPDGRVARGREGLGTPVGVGDAGGTVGSPFLLRHVLVRRRRHPDRGPHSGAGRQGDGDHGRKDRRPGASTSPEERRTNLRDQASTMIDPGHRRSRVLPDPDPTGVSPTALRLHRAIGFQRFSPYAR